MAEACEAQNLPRGFVYLADKVPGVRLDVRYHGADNFTGAPVPGYEAGCVVVTDEAARALKKVQEELASFALALKVFDGYRPQRAVDHFVRWVQARDDSSRKALHYPNIEKKDLLSRGFIARRSAHSRGSTVDLTLVSAEADEPRELDMGSGFDYFDQVSRPEDLSVTPQQRANRLLLRAVMGKQGFTPFAMEWWHFTLKNEPFPDTWFDFPVR